MTTSQPMVSIVCTNYNKNEWIRDAIESFLRQETKFEYEIILIDDASTDVSPAIIKEYTERYPDRIRAFYNKKNLGITKTWVKICKEARGKYIARCDGDDYWTDVKKLQKQVDLLEHTKDSAWCSTDYDIITPEGKLTQTSAFENKLVNRSATYAEMLATKGFTMSSTWLVETKLMQEVNAGIESSAVDDTFNIQLDLFVRTKLSYLPEATVVYRINDGSDSRPIEIEKIRSRNEMLLKTQLEYIEKYREVDYGDILKILLPRDMQHELWAIERLQIIQEQRKHITKQEAHIIELEGILHAITESPSYRLATTCAGYVRTVIGQPSKIAKKVLRIIEKFQYKKYIKKDTQHTENIAYQPLISVIVPTYNPSEKFLTETIHSVVNQTYQNWELVVIDDASTDKNVHKFIQLAANIDKRITYKFLEANLQIADATNEGIKIAQGEFIALLDHDDVLLPNALYEVAKSLNTKDYDFIFSDEDRLENGKRHQPFYKPGWNQDFMYSVNYITHLAVIRKELIEKVGYQDGSFNGAQDWELFLRCMRAIPENKIHHIPEVLYSWRAHPTSTAQSMDAKPYAIDAQRRAIESDLDARGYKEYQVVQDDTYKGQWKVLFRVNGEPRVTIMLDDASQSKSIKQKISKVTAYKNYDIVTASSQDTTSDVTGDYIVYIQDDFSLTNPDWIQSMIADAQRTDIGFVQARLMSTKMVMQNITSLVGKTQLVFLRNASRRILAKNLYLTCRYNIPVVHGGIVMIEKKKLVDSDSLISAAPVDEISKSLHENGYRNLYNPYVR